jgi:uncharacterized membrane protein
MSIFCIIDVVVVVLTVLEAHQARLGIRAEEFSAFAYARPWRS